MPSRRLEAIKRLKDEGLFRGMFFLSVIPYLTDRAEIIERSLTDAKNAGVDFVIFGPMTLKEGRQKDHFMKIIAAYNQELLGQYEEIYSNTSKWGEPVHAYLDSLHTVFDVCARV